VLKHHNQNISAVTGLAPYSGEWTKWTAAHLLRRTTYGPSFLEIEEAAKPNGMNSTVELLLSSSPPSPPPIVYSPISEPNLEVGETWVTAPHPTGGGKLRHQSLTGWFYLNVMLAPLGIREKMCVFWLNYFGMSGVRDPRSMYKSMSMFLENGTGNFRTMIERITVDPSMLEFLNGEINNKRNPNENYARELLELFTIQKGAQVAPGDYTTYTEQDVTELARALTGWKNLDFVFSDDDTPIDSYFDEENHDTDTKQLSHRFGNARIENAGAEEYKVVIDIIMQQPETARAFCREIYRYFVFYDITPEVEQNVISPLAELFRSVDFEIAPVLSSLLKSEHFYDMQIRGAMIKNPLDFVANIFRPFGEFSHIQFPTIVERYTAAIKHDRWCRDLQMSYNDLPTVSGWLAYYQAPNYYRNWISTSTIQRRFSLVKLFMAPNYHVNNFRLPTNWRDFLASLSDPYSVNDVLNDIIVSFFPREISPTQFNVLKQALLGAQDDDEWRVQYGAYLANVEENSVTFTFERRLFQLFTIIFGMPEGQLQ